MAYFTAGITNIKATQRANNPNEFRLTWDSTYVDLLHQIYLNGELVHITQSVDEPYMTLLRASSDGPNHFGVLAVDYDTRDTNYFETAYSTELARASRIKVTFPALMKYGYDAHFNVYQSSAQIGGSPGTPSTLMNDNPIPIFPDGIFQGGFGLGEFGYGGFGWDGSNAIGFGLGAFGYGEFGFDAPMITWISDRVARAEYGIAAKTVDIYGNLAVLSNQDDVTIDPYPRSAKELVVSSAAGTTITFGWSASPDI